MARGLSTLILKPLALVPQNELYRLRSQAVEGRAALQSPPKAPASSAAAGGPYAFRLSESVLTSFTPKIVLPSESCKLHRHSTAARPERFQSAVDAKALFTEVAHAFGLEVVFDSGVPARSGHTFRIDGGRLPARRCTPGSRHGLLCGRPFRRACSWW